MLRSLKNWLYDRDPLEPLAFEAPLRSLKTRIAAGEPYFGAPDRPPSPRQSSPDPLHYGRISSRPSAKLPRSDSGLMPRAPQ